MGGSFLQVLADAREETLQLIDSSVLQGTGSGDGFAHVPNQATAIRILSFQ